MRTFLIADVRGYTRFTQERGDKAGAGLAETFAQLARNVIEASGGELIELRGDEALAVFGSARQAIRAAVELQTRFRAPDSGFPLGVGIFSLVADSSARVQMGPVGWFADIPAASNFVAQLLSCASFLPASPENLNYSEFCDRRVEAAIDRARRAHARDPRAGGELWAAADRALMEAAPAVPFANLRSVALVSERVGNYQYRPLVGTLLDQLWVR
jgi:hypothetical protein